MLFPKFSSALRIRCFLSHVFSSRVSSLVFPLCVCFSLSSVVLFPCLRRFSLALLCTVCVFFLLAFCCTVFFWLSCFGSFSLFPLCVCVLLFLVCFDNPPIPPVLLLFFPVVVLFCWPIKIARNGPIKNPDNGRKSANQREVEGANQRAVLCTN